MREIFKGRMIAVLLMTCLIIFSASQASAVMTGLGTEELTKASKTVILGEVESVESRWREDGATIFTTASVLVKEVVAGEAFQQRINVEYEGGEVGDTGLRVSDVSPLVKGEEVLLFLKTVQGKTDGSAYNIVGKAQGKYKVGKDGTASKGGFSLIEGREAVDNDIPIDELIEKIRRVK